MHSCRGTTEPERPQLAAYSDDELDIPKATTGEHDTIRAEFSKSLPSQALARLEENLLSDAKFEAWIVALRTYAPEEVRRWGHFRRQRLSDLLQARVNEAEITTALRGKVLAQIHASEAAAYETRKGGGKGAAENEPAAIATVNDPNHEVLGRARWFAHAAIDRLSYDELRALKIPLGALLDVVHRGT